MSENKGEAANKPSGGGLRSMEPDLEITVRGTSSSMVFHNYKATMASFYDFFDAMFASGMAESVDGKVTLEDVEPEVFELATTLLETPMRARTAGPADAIQVALFYHKYNSKLGLDLVEGILCEFFDQMIAKENDEFPTTTEMEIIVDALAFSTQANLSSLVTKGKEFLSERFLTINFLKQFQLQEVQMKKVVGFLAANMDCYQAFHGAFFEGQDAPEFHQEDAPNWFLGATRDLCNMEYLSTVISRRHLCINSSWKVDGSVDLINKRNGILVRDQYSSIGLSFNGRNTREFNLFDVIHTNASASIAPCSLLRPKCGRAGVDYSYSDWAAILTFPRTDQEALVLEFVFPYSGNQIFPPLDDGWKLLNPLDDGEVSIYLKD